MMDCPTLTPDIEADIERAVDVMRAGGIILYPTDTVWGLGCDAENPQAVARIYRLKRRAETKSMLVLVSGREQVKKYIMAPDETHFAYMEEPTPTTVIFPRARLLASNLISEDGTIGMRMSRELFSQELCRRLGRPIVSTSANISGRPTPALFSEIEEEIRAGVDYTAQYRREDTARHAPSRILLVPENGEPLIWLRR